VITEGKFLSLVHAQAGHFVHESGYHSDVWWDLEALCHRPNILLPFVAALATRVREYQPDVVCGALVEGAFIALLVASELCCDFAYALRFASDAKQLFPVSYRLPDALHSVVESRRVVIVNDVISAGSAVRGTIEHVQQLGGQVLAVASLMLLGETFSEFCEAKRLPLITLFRQDHHLWLPDTCPLCSAGGTPEYLAHN
jgi:orotate phosphoribosyltransferase